ncbi:DUF2911 domain-containing protein [Spirosoma foliorum]|uniref:DUF2911 domain-containing protein n=1 Tax=Spirosoma foliorum TaxID=2710596 RepID=A0A7G5GNP4_9BACT|nr:DUF2911 domain-containing protein [Spirosoma foliorum]QMW00486.1 DUF2911 domain-containing protein [Spirosoma foliorum]
MKRLLLILGIIAAVVLIGYFSLRSWTKSSSPEAVAQVDQNGLKIKVDYCQPYKKGRKIFGGLVPYGKVWRTGANEATIIEFDQNVVIAGQPLEKGEYTLWTIPSSDGWIAIFNSETGQWGTSYDQTKDVLRVPVASRKHSPMAEQFYISFSPSTTGTDMVLAWDETEAIIPVQKRTNND